MANYLLSCKKASSATESEISIIINSSIIIFVGKLNFWSMIGGSSLSDCACRHILRQKIKRDIFLISLSCGFCSCTDRIIKASLVCTLLVISQKAQPRGSCMKMVPHLLLLKGQRRSGRKPLSLWQSMALQLSSLCHQPRSLGPPNCRVHHLTSHP